MFVLLWFWERDETCSPSQRGAGSMATHGEGSEPGCEEEEEWRTRKCSLCFCCAAPHNVHNMTNMTRLKLLLPSSWKKFGWTTSSFPDLQHRVSLMHKAWKRWFPGQLHVIYDSSKGLVIFSQLIRYKTLVYVMADNQISQIKTFPGEDSHQSNSDQCYILVWSDKNRSNKSVTSIIFVDWRKKTLVSHERR